MFEVGDRFKYSQHRGGFISRTLVFTGTVVASQSWDHGDGIYEYEVRPDDPNVLTNENGTFFVRSNYMTRLA